MRFLRIVPKHVAHIAQFPGPLLEGGRELPSPAKIRSPDTAHRQEDIRVQILILGVVEEGNDSIGELTLALEGGLDCDVAAESLWRMEHRIERVLPRARPAHEDAIRARAVVAIDLGSQFLRDELQQPRYTGRGRNVRQIAMATVVVVRNADDEHFRDFSGAGKQVHRRAHVLKMLETIQNEQHRIPAVVEVVIARAVHLIAAHLAQALRMKQKPLTHRYGLTSRGRRCRKTEVGRAERQCRKTHPDCQSSRHRNPPVTKT